MSKAYILDGGIGRYKSVKYMSMNIVADKIDILGVCSREEESERYAEECASYFRTDEEQKYFTIPDLTDIGGLSS